MKTRLGIDPGLEGAVASIDTEGRVRVVDTPIVTIKDGKSKKRRYDIPAMVGALTGSIAGPWSEAYVVLEKVHAMPKQGVASSFNFGAGFGIWLGILAALRLRHELVDPRRWTKILLADMPKGDEAAVLRAGQLYPDAASELRTDRGRLLLGRADAILLAHYARKAMPV
jgi:crossover junction endodeoxyribonuclease RuvC